MSDKRSFCRRLSEPIGLKNCPKTQNAIERPSKSENLEHGTGKQMSSLTELLMEFLAAVMTKDYERALIYCSEILHHEPKNTTALEFYPLIVEKLRIKEEEEEENEDTSDSSSSDSSLNSSSSENIFFSERASNKSENSVKQQNERHGKEGGKVTVDNNNVNSSKSVPLEKKLKKKNIQSSESGIPPQQPKTEEATRTAQSDAMISNHFLVHPTRTVTLTPNNVTNTKTSCSKVKEKKQTDNGDAKGTKCSETFLQTSPTIVFSKNCSYTLNKE